MTVYANDKYLDYSINLLKTFMGRSEDVGTVQYRPRIRVYSGTLPVNFDDWILNSDPYASALLLDSMMTPTYDPSSTGIQYQIVNGEIQFVTPHTATATGTGTASWFVAFVNEYDSSTTTTADAAAAVVGTVTDLANLNTTPAPMVLNSSNITSGNPYDFVQISVKVATP